MGYSQLVFPNDTTFLIAGGAGFIGSNLCEAILNLGHRAICLDDLSNGKQSNVDRFLGNVDLRVGFRTKVERAFEQDRRNHGSSSASIVVAAVGGERVKES